MSKQRHRSGIQLLTDFAFHLNRINQASPDEEPFYELMSGALVWHDETSSDTPTEVIWALRPIWAYRTSLMLSKPRVEHLELWNQSLLLFPDWIGFLPERRDKNASYLEIYRQGEFRMRACIREFENEGN